MSKEKPKCPKCNDETVLMVYYEWQDERIEGVYYEEYLCLECRHLWCWIHPDISHFFVEG